MEVPRAVIFEDISYVTFEVELIKAGYEVVGIAKSEEEAWELAAKLPRLQPAVALVDNNFGKLLPIGNELVQTIRKKQDSIYIIGVSGEVGSPKGADDYWKKSPETAVLQKLLLLFKHGFEVS